MLSHLSHSVSNLASFRRCPTVLTTPRHKYPFSPEHFSSLCLTFFLCSPNVFLSPIPPFLNFFPIHVSLPPAPVKTYLFAQFGFVSLCLNFFFSFFLQFSKFSSSGSLFMSLTEHIYTPRCPPLHLLNCFQLNFLVKLTDTFEVFRKSSFFLIEVRSDLIIKI